MGEPPPPLLLLLLSLAGRGAAGESNFQQDLAPEEHYRCLGKLWPVPQQESKIVADTKIVYSLSIPHSGPHRPFGAAPGEYRYCPPQRWLHNLKQGGVAFLYHPCAHPSLRGQLTLLARACLPDYILTPHGGLTQEWPLALVAWGATLQMAKVELAHAVAWLKKHAAQESRRKPWAGRRYRHLMKRPAARAVGRAVCPADRMQVLQKLFCHLDANRRRRELPPSDRQGTERPPHPHGASDLNSAGANHGRDGAAILPSASPNLAAKRKGVLAATGAKGSSQMPAVPQSLRPGLGGRPLLTTAQAAGGAAQKRDCPCPDGDHPQAPGQQLKAAKVREAGERVHTPRTEEAAWAASALTFLLVTLTLAVLYTRLHRNCRRGQSLYWTMSGEDGRETVATVIKRRILSTQSRRKKRPRQHRALLQTTSSESSE
ncbi:PREDICTED: tumor protein p53-inducible protein 13 isoform X2 [Gekko japonicus]|uniref:Tumor protein p53-inducible protein 13 isoform X2 n=1 Tax=Gekko japonicus TaxID=146911 RepID=A0ABM1KUZ3_GEKJA|nr:PREDICTED: tumor protein p53-inducible protein 13 isoform X2 [Gekko japonicus]